MSHTTKPRPASTLEIIHNGDYSGEVILCGQQKNGDLFQIDIDGPDFLELCEAVASDSILEKIHAALGV